MTKFDQCIVVTDSRIKNKQLILILLDFSKAFDRINHKLLLFKLKNLFNFSLFTDYLFQSYIYMNAGCVFEKKSPIQNF